MSTRSHFLNLAQGRRRVGVFEAGEGKPLVFLYGAGGIAEDSAFLAALARHWALACVRATSPGLW